MPLRRTDLPTDPDQLAELVLQLDADNERLWTTLHAINTLHFGTRSERLVILVEAQMTRRGPASQRAGPVALSEAPGRFAPIFGRDAHGAIDVGPWCRGFHAAIQLNPKFWQKLLPARGLAHKWLIPILAHCTNADGRPVRGAPPHGPRRCRCHPGVLGSHPIQGTLLTAPATRVQSRLTQATPPRCCPRNGYGTTNALA